MRHGERRHQEECHQREGNGKLGPEPASVLAVFYQRANHRSVVRVQTFDRLLRVVLTSHPGLLSGFKGPAQRTRRRSLLTTGIPEPQSRVAVPTTLAGVQR